MRNGYLRGARREHRQDERPDSRTGKIADVSRKFLQEISQKLFFTTNFKNTSNSKAHTVKDML